jgi:hypothetical protein
MPTYVAVLALVLAYVALVAAYAALRTLAKLRRATRVLARGARSEGNSASLLEATQLNAERIEVLTEQLEQLRGSVDADRGGVAPGALRNVALVRYDAFSEMSGRMSFSVALLDEKGDGITLSAITGTGETRVYAKGVADGKGEHELSPEETQAVHAALAKRKSWKRAG